MKVLIRCVLLFISCLLLFSSCRKFPIDTNPSVKLLFSTDTVYFDTVFTTIGSSVIYFKVYNKQSENISISNISIAGANASFFHLNVNGVPGTSFSNVIINPKDSIYVYVVVNVNPTNVNNPFVIFDSILFNTNGNRQRIVLEAYGQNAYFHNAQKLVSGNFVWLSDKPHVVINSLEVDTNATLTISPGTRVYMHPNSSLYVFGTVNAVGTVTDSITFQGDRLEEYYVGLPGNWGGILFAPSSKNNLFTHVLIKDGTDGVTVDSLSVNDNYKLVLNKCMIRNMADAGIVSYTGSLLAENCLVYNCNNYCAEFVYGGHNVLDFCTFADYGNITINHQYPSVVVTNYYTNASTNISYSFNLAPTQDYFTDCIIYGGLNSELAIDSVHYPSSPYVPMLYSFTNCNIELTNTPPVPLPANFVSCQINENPNFNGYPNGSGNDLTVSTATNPPTCIGKGVPIQGITVDFDENTRNSKAPTIGCFEK